MLNVVFIFLIVAYFFIRWVLYNITCIINVTIILDLGHRFLCQLETDGLAVKVSGELYLRLRNGFHYSCPAGDFSKGVNSTCITIRPSSKKEMIAYSMIAYSSSYLTTPLSFFRVNIWFYFYQTLGIWVLNQLLCTWTRNSFNNLWIGSITKNFCFLPHLHIRFFLFYIFSQSSLFIYSKHE
jgi:hypothetical protein